MSAYSSSIIVSNSYFNNNVAHDNGGIMHVNHRSSITIDNIFLSNMLWLTVILPSLCIYTVPPYLPLLLL